MLNKPQKKVVICKSMIMEPQNNKLTEQLEIQRNLGRAPRLEGRAMLINHKSFIYEQKVTNVSGFVINTSLYVMRKVHVLFYHPYT